ncbi:serine hydrolase domain-containing protein [Nocardiopsis suaedae]|nr:serine hydrolase domain-containing protein [Nocardiopsis suaedae]
MTVNGPMAGRTRALQRGPGAAVRGLLAAAASLGLLAPAHPAAADPSGPEGSVKDAADAYVAAYADRQGLPGLSYAVLQDGEAAARGGVGGLGPDSPVPAASVSKAFTAFAVLQLVDEGRIGLDTPVQTVLPEFSIGGEGAGGITVRMLLSHTSGLPNPMIIPAASSYAESVAEIADLDLASTPGTTYAYSNLNYRTLARVVEAATDTPFDRYLEDEVFAPLGMDDTFSVHSTNDAEAFTRGHVTAYGTSIPLREMSSDVGGSGGIVSTADDISAFLAMIQRGGTASDGTRLLSDDLVRRSMETQEGAGTYGLGWQHTSTADPARVGHDGALPRSSARIDVVPSTGTATVVLMDSYTPTYQHPFTVSTGLIDIARGASPEIPAPVPTLIDLGLLLVTLLVVALATRGARRAGRWASRHRASPVWRRAMRLIPLALMPTAAFVLFIGLTSGPGNPATPVDAFALWPAATVLLLVGALASAAVALARLTRLREANSAMRPGTDAARPPQPPRTTS